MKRFNRRNKSLKMKPASMRDLKKINIQKNQILAPKIKAGSIIARGSLDRIQSRNRNDGLSKAFDW